MHRDQFHWAHRECTASSSLHWFPAASSHQSAASDTHTYSSPHIQGPTEKTLVWPQPHWWGYHSVGWWSAVARQRIADKQTIQAYYAATWQYIFDDSPTTHRISFNVQHTQHWLMIVSCRVQARRCQNRSVPFHISFVELCFVFMPSPTNIQARHHHRHNQVEISPTACSHDRGIHSNTFAKQLLNINKS